MSALSTYALIHVLASASGTAAESITPGSHLVRDVRLDSLEFLHVLAELEDLGWVVAEQDIPQLHTVADLMGALSPISAAVS